MQNKGNADNGRMLVNSVGCLGCHATEGEEQVALKSVNSMRREHGPNLNQSRFQNNPKVDIQLDSRSPELSFWH